MLHHLSEVFLSLFQSPIKHFIMQPFGVSVGLYGLSSDRWGASIHQEGEEMQKNKKIDETTKGRKDIRA